MTFFLQWSVEAKFFFIFGCLIALVVPAAGIIRTKNSWKRAKHILLVDEESSVPVQTAQVIPFEEDTLFGIEAMEEDFQIDGLWNSKTSTPFHTPLPSPTTSSRQPSSIRSAIAKLSHSRRGSSISSVSKFDLSETQVAKTGFDHAVRQVDGEACNQFSNTQVLIEGAEHAQPGSIAPALNKNLTHPKLVNRHQKLICDIHSACNNTMQHLGGASTCIPAGSSMKRSRRFIIGAVSNPDPLKHSITETPSKLRDLEILGQMEANRRVQAAESGQLQPRTQDTARSSISLITPRYRNLANDATYQTPRSVSWPIARNETIVKMIVPQGKPQRRVSPPAIPFRAFIEMHPPPKACPSAWTEKTQDLLDEKLGTSMKMTSFTITASSHNRSTSMSSSSTLSEQITTPRTTTFQSASICKANDGFELLPTSCLEKPAPVKEFGNTSSLPSSQIPCLHNDAKPRMRDVWSETSSSDGTVYHHESLHSPLGSTIY